MADNRDKKRASTGAKPSAKKSKSTGGTMNSIKTPKKSKKKTDGTKNSKKRKSHGKKNKGKGREQTGFETPEKTSRGRPPTPKSLVASTRKQELEKYSVEAKQSKEQFQPGNEEKKGMEAKRMIAEKTKRLPLRVSNSMWPFVSELTLTKDGTTTRIHLMRNEVNHNTISPSLSNEITNNFLGNPIGANRGDKLHDRTMGTDMKCILTYNANVSLIGKKLHFVKKFILIIFYKL